MPRPLRLASEEIASAFADEAVRDRYPPILTIEQFAKLFQVSSRTAKQWIGHGDFNGATTKIGKHRRIWRDRAVQIAFSRDRTRPRPTAPTPIKQGERDGHDEERE